jgi:transposase
MTQPHEVEAEILRLHYGEHWRIGTIARQLGVHADVVRRVLANRLGASAPSNRDRVTQLSPYRAFIQQTLDEFPTLRATRLYDMLRERGYEGSPRTVRDYVAKVRPKRRAGGYLRLETLAGEQAQIDWAHVGKIAVPGGERSLWAFVIVFSYSRAMWAELVIDTTVHSLCRSLTRAAAYFGGVTRQWLFDNPKTVVLQRFGDAVRFQPALLGLCAHLRVQPRLCGVRQPEDKGKVERAIRYLRDRFFAGRYVTDVAEGNHALLQFFDEIALKRQHPVQTTRTVAEVFTEERERLLALPDPLPSTEYVIPVNTDRQAFIRLDTNRYSVPLDHADRALSLAFDDRTLRVLDGATEVASHTRSYGRNQVFEVPAHRAEALRQRRAATDLKGRDRLRAVTPLIDDLLERWVDDGRQVGPMCFRLGRVLDLYGATIFAAAVEDVLDTGATDFGALNVACERRRRHFARPVPLDVSMPAHIPDRDVIPHSLENYDE